MVKAHKIAKSMEGDYQARLSLALRQAWKEERSDKMTYQDYKAYNEFGKEEIRAFGKNKANYDGKIIEGTAYNTGHVYLKHYKDLIDVRIIPYDGTGDSDIKVAKKIGRVFVEMNNDEDIVFYGDTYNQKENIKKFKAEWDKLNKVWKIKTIDLSDDEFVSVLKAVMENFDYSQHTEDEFNEMIEDFS